MKQSIQKQSAPVNLDTMPLRASHIRVMLVASLGQFLGQGLATLVGIVLPLMQLCFHPEISSEMQGLLGCISLIGIMIGSAVIGSLSDKYGYLFFYRLCPAAVLAAALVAVFIPHVAVLACALFVMGLGVGGEYSLDPDYISELMPVKWRELMIGISKALASVGSAFVAVICYIVLTHGAEPRVWSALFWIIAGIAALMLLLRLHAAQSPAWLAQRGEYKQAQQAVTKMLGPGITLPAEQAKSTEPVQNQSIGKFIATHMRKVILTGVPWACEGLGVYGIGIFLPILIMAFGLDSLPADATKMQHIVNSVGLTFVLCIVMIIGFALGMVLLRRAKYLRQQVWGFIFSAIGLGLLLAAYLLHWPTWIAITGFVIFELALNAGPHLITFVLPSHAFAVAERGTGSGIAAAVGKSGAVIGAFAIPVLLRHAGAEGVLWVSIAVMLAGALVTILFRPKNVH